MNPLDRFAEEYMDPFLDYMEPLIGYMNFLHRSYGSP